MALVTLKEAAPVLKITAEALSRMAAEKRIPAMKIGGRWRLDLEEVKRVLHN